MEILGERKKLINGNPVEWKNIVNEIEYERTSRNTQENKCKFYRNESTNEQPY